MTIEVSNASFQVSLSAFQVWQRCEMRYFYSYVRKLRVRDQYTAPTLGRLLHTYLEHYYGGLHQGYGSEDAHLAAQMKTSAEFLPEIRGYVNTSIATGNIDLARELNALPTLAGRITDRYYQTRGKGDAERYEVLFIEEQLKLPIAEGIHSTGVADLVTRDRETGRQQLWEHKSTENVPRDSVRLRDFQTMLYATKLRWLTGIVVDSILWNYLRTKEPVKPEVLKSGELTRRKDLDSTWQTYLDAASEAGLILGPGYEEVKDRLDGREETVFFPRYEQVIVVEEAVLMDDYIEEAIRMKAARESWLRGDSHPIRTISRDCDFCEYFRICQAALTGGDEADVIRMRFTGG